MHYYEQNWILSRNDDKKQRNNKHLSNARLLMILQYIDFNFISQNIWLNFVKLVNLHLMNYKLIVFLLCCKIYFSTFVFCLDITSCKILFGVYVAWKEEIINW